MIKKTLLFSNPAHLSLKNGQLVIDSKSNSELITRPIEDLGLIVLESTNITITAALLSELTDNNVAVMVCDQKHMPTGMLLPLSANSLLSEKTRHQLNASLPLKKQLWQQTVIAKIKNQSSVLIINCENDCCCMEHWAKMVRSGDPDNLEARAAVFYWKNLFKGRPDFKRGDDSDPINSILNYGYAILRAVIARAIVGGGLIPQSGLFHSNKYNSFCLADDLMEPYRPIVDNLVCEIIRKHKITEGITKEIKKELLSIPVIDIIIGKVKRPLMIAATMTVAALSKCFSGELRKLSYPDIK